MKKVTIINELDGRQFYSEFSNDEIMNSWIADCELNEYWGQREKWRLNPVEGRVLDTREVEVNLFEEPTFHTEYLIKADYVITIEDITSEYELSQLREKRNAILSSTDKFMLSDYPITEEVRAQYVQYRAYLRNITTEIPLPLVPKTFEEFILG